MLNRIRIKFVKEIVELNERLVFNRRIIKYYKNELSKNLKTAIDVGVNTGQSIEIFRAINKDYSIIGFEPNPSLFRIIQKKYANQSNIKLYQLGISNQKGSKIFHENVLHSTSSFEELNFDSKYLIKKANILGVNKDEIISEIYSVKNNYSL